LPCHEDALRSWRTHTAFPTASSQRVCSCSVRHRLQEPRFGVFRSAGNGCTIFAP
jgi:hypothetical protein